MRLFHAYIYRCAYFTRIYIGTLATRPHLGATRPRVGIAKLGGRCPNLAIRKCIVFACQVCLSRHRALTSKCRRGDASPPGEDALPAGKGTLSAGEGTLSTGEDALHAHPYIYHYILFRISDRFLCPSCSIQGKRYG